MLFVVGSNHAHISSYVMSIVGFIALVWLCLVVSSLGVHGTARDTAIVLLSVCLSVCAHHTSAQSAVISLNVLDW